MNSIKYYFRNYAPLWLYKIGRTAKHLPARLKAFIFLDKQSLLVEEQYVPISYKGTSFKIKLNPKNGFVDSELYSNKIWEPSVTKFIYNHLKEGGVFVDVGANIGYYSLMAAAKQGRTGKVYAFEPLPSLCKQIKNSITKNNFTSIDLFEVGCGDINGSLTIHTYPENIGKSSLQCDPGNTNATLLVPIVRLDDELAQLEHIDVLKLDIEGYEYEALKGAQSLITRTRPIILLEVAVNRLRKETGSNEKTLNILHLLWESRYEIHTIKGDIVTDAKKFIERQTLLGSHVELIARPH